MTLHSTSDNGYVRVTVKYHPRGSGAQPYIGAAVKLLDFDLDAIRLKINHELFIAHYARMLSAIPNSRLIILGGGPAIAAGNRRSLSQGRAYAVLKALWDYGADPTKIALDDGLGGFSFAHNADGLDRAIEILVTCPPSSREHLEEFETSWNADPWRPRAQEPE